MIAEEVIRDLSFPSVREWKESHPAGKAIAYFPVYAPVEIISAAGMLPVGLHGGGDGLDLQHADARFGSFICSIAKTTMELGMTGRLRVFDGMLFSSICDTARNLCFVLKRNLPDVWIDFLHLPHNPTSPASLGFLISEYMGLVERLESLGGVRVSDQALRRAIQQYNDNRDLTRHLVRFRSAFPQLLGTSELYTVIRAGNFVAVEEHNALLRRTFEQMKERKGKERDFIRVVVEGAFCEQPPLDLLRIIEQAGCYIVDDDFLIGRNWIREEIPVDGDPLENLARAYLEQSVYSSVRHDPRQPRTRALVEKVRRRRADAVLSLIAKFCEPAYFDYVLFKRELEKESIPHLLLEFEEKMFTFDRIQVEIETFVESLLFA